MYIMHIQIINTIQVYEGVFGNQIWREVVLVYILESLWEQDSCQEAEDSLDKNAASAASKSLLL